MKRGPSHSQEVTLARHLVMILESPVFRRNLKAFRAAWKLRLDKKMGQWVLPWSQRKDMASYDDALKTFGRYYFDGLGGQFLASKLISKASWESKSTVFTVKELVAFLKQDAANGVDWAVGDAYFYATRVWWDDQRLQSDLSSIRWRVEPSAEHAPALSKRRRFIEIFPWTEEEDVKSAFRALRQLPLTGRRNARRSNMLPRALRFRRSLERSLDLYQRWCDGEQTKTLLRDFFPDERANSTENKGDLRRHLQKIAEMLGLPSPSRPR